MSRSLWHPPRIRLKSMVSHVLVAAHVGLLLCGAHFLLKERLTNAIFDRIVQNTVAPSMSDEERVLTLMATTHRIQWGAKALVSPKNDAAPFEVPGTAYQQGPNFHLLAPVGACGSFTVALAKTLERAGIDHRVALMDCGLGRVGCHILLEARVDGRWAVLDPIVDQSFRRPDGKLASFADVSADWPHYRHQIPSWRTQLDADDEQYYDLSLYNYHGVQYTNWEKVPIILPAIRSLLVALFGQPWVDDLALNTLVFARNRLYLMLMAGLYLWLWLATVGWWVWGRRQDTSIASSHPAPRSLPTRSSPV